MAGGVAIPKGISKHVAVPVKTLRICYIRHNRIRAHKPTDARQIVASVEVDEAEVIVVLLAGVAAVGIGLAGGGAVAAEGEVAGAAATDPVTITTVAHDTVAAQVVAVQVQQVVGLARDDLPHGDGLPGEEVDAAAGDSAGGLDTALPPRPCRVMLLPSPGLRRVELEWDRG